MTSTKQRDWVVRWLYGAALAHLVVGIALPWIGNWPVFDGYHRQVEAAFWSDEVPDAARAQQIWWISLFGPTLQSLALWMAALVRFGDRYHSPFAWGMLIGGVLVWAPQDIVISLSAHAWAHVWVDGIALLTLLPPLAWLCRQDRQRAAPSTTSTTRREMA